MSAAELFKTLKEALKSGDETAVRKLLGAYIEETKEQAKKALQAEHEGKRSRELERLPLEATGKYGPGWERLQFAALPGSGVIKSVDDVVASVLPTSPVLKGTDVGALVKRLQDLHDTLVLLDAVWSHRRHKDVRSSKAWEEYQALRQYFNEKIFYSAGEAADLIPTELSARMQEAVELELRVAALFNRFNMPTPTWELPVFGGPATAYLVSEQTADDAELTAGNRVPASTPTTGKVTFTAKKFGARVDITGEAEEDSIVNVIEYIRNRMARGLAEGLENAIINGDDSATHMDADVTSANDVRKAWQGLRKVASARSAEVSLSTFNVTNILSLRYTMEEYAINPQDVVFITGIAGMYQFLNLQEVITVDKAPERFATLYVGQIGSLWGVPIVVSPLVREDLNASGVYDGVTTNTTHVLCVNKGAWGLAVRRGVQVRAETVILTDVSRIVTLARWAFAPLYSATTEKVVANGIAAPTTL